MKYNYLESLKRDIRMYLKENNITKWDWDELEEALWVEDSVTGNGSGSYTFNTYEAERCLKGNLKLLEKALTEFGYCIRITGDEFDKCKIGLPKDDLRSCLKANVDIWHCVPDINIWDKGAEWCDVTIRCYLLNEAMWQVKYEDFDN